MNTLKITLNKRPKAKLDTFEEFFADEILKEPTRDKYIEVMNELIDRRNLSRKIVDDY